MGPFCFQAEGRKTRSKLALIFFVFILCYSIYILLRMHVWFHCVRFSFLVLRQEIGLGERLRYELFCVGWYVKPSASL